MARRRTSPKKSHRRQRDPNMMGGSSRMEDGRDAIKALTWKEVREIAENFNRLNPYRHSVEQLLKIEDVNFIDKPKRQQRQVFGYAVSAKRYALYVRMGNDIHVVKASGHGLDGSRREQQAPIIRV